MKTFFWVFAVYGFSLCLAGPTTDITITLRIEGHGPRPYVVVWVEDTKNTYIRTLQTWGTKAKYQRRLRNWNRVAEGVDGVSGATRPNGDYRLQWDGTDAQGQPVQPGTYLVRAESVREDGPHCQIECEIKLDGSFSTAQGTPDEDIRSLSVTVKPSASERP